MNTSLYNFVIVLSKQQSMYTELVIHRWLLNGRNEVVKRLRKCETMLQLLFQFIILL